IDHRTQRRAEALWLLLNALRFVGPVEHQRTESGHRGSAAMAFLADRELSGSEVLETEERQFEAILHADFLEEAREVDLHRALGNHEGGGDLLVLQALGEQADQLAFALGKSDASGAEEA